MYAHMNKWINKPKKKKRTFWVTLVKCILFRLSMEYRLGWAFCSHITYSIKDGYLGLFRVSQGNSNITSLMNNELSSLLRATQGIIFSTL
jgi:hypothetical protein